jgi:NAD(P) transhydrogenase subunit beta
MSLGLAIGAITFSGSVIAFLKLDGRMSGAPITFANQHKLNAILGGVLVFLVFLFVFFHIVIFPCFKIVTIHVTKQ